MSLTAMQPQGGYSAAFMAAPEGGGQSKAEAPTMDEAHKDHEQLRCVFVAALIFTTLVIVTGTLLALKDVSATAAQSPKKPPPTAMHITDEARSKAMASFTLCALTVLGMVLQLAYVVFIKAKYGRGSTSTADKLLPLPAFLVMCLSISLMLAFDGYLVFKGPLYPGPALYFCFTGPALFFGRSLSIIPLSALMLRLVMIYFYPFATYRRNLNVVMAGYILFALLPLVVIFISASIKNVAHPMLYPFGGSVVIRLAHLIWHIVLCGIDGFLSACLFVVRRQLARHDIHLMVAFISLSALWWVSLMIAMIRIYTPLSSEMWPQCLYTANLGLQSLTLFILRILGYMNPRMGNGVRLVMWGIEHHTGEEYLTEHKTGKRMIPTGALSRAATHVFVHQVPGADVSGQEGSVKAAKGEVLDMYSVRSDV